VARSLKGDGPSPFSLPWREFVADLLAWAGLGFFLALIYLFYFQAPGLTGVKVVMGCLCFGIFGGMRSYLSAERHIMEQPRESIRAETGAPGRMLSVGTKMLFFTVTVLVFMALVVLLMVFMDINYLITHKDVFGPDIFMGVFKEIVFAFLVLLGLSLSILTRYSRNLKRILAYQLEAMERVGRGDYETPTPVLSNDEFGLIAAKTNDMMGGLKEKDFCRMSFAKYMTPEVSEKILKGEISPEGELGRVTILFCDLRGYTPFVEKRDPKDVVRFLNTYFGEMERCIRGHNGIVLQYIGDEIEAVFGHPIREPDHALAAVEAALEMRERLGRLNREREALGEESVRHGIGIHTGEVLAGSVGSPDRLVYAMVGDTVNAASRIQNLNKQFGTDILISDTTKALLPPGRIATQSLGTTSIRGKSESIEIHEVL
jgi:adenylate cyclase